MLYEMVKIKPENNKNLKEILDKLKVLSQYYEFT
jgi:hypothetical protein